VSLLQSICAIAAQPAPALKGSVNSDAPQPAGSATGRTAIAFVAVTTITVLPCILGVVLPAHRERSTALVGSCFVANAES